MVLSESAIATLITGGVGVAAVIASKFKCLIECDGCCSVRAFKMGVLENSLVDEHNVEFKKITANGNDLIYVSKNILHEEDDEEPEQCHVHDNNLKKQL